MNDEKIENMPKYSGAWLPWNRRRLPDGTIVFKVTDREHGPCIVVDNSWDTVVRIIVPSKQAQKRLFAADCATAEELIKAIFESERGAFALNPSAEPFELGDRVWLLLDNMDEIESTRLSLLEDGSVEDYDRNAIYPKNRIIVTQRRVPYDLIDDPGFMRFLGR